MALAHWHCTGTGTHPDHLTIAHSTSVKHWIIHESKINYSFNDAYGRWWEWFRLRSRNRQSFPIWHYGGGEQEREGTIHTHRIDEENQLGRLIMSEWLCVDEGIAFGLSLEGNGLTLDFHWHGHYGGMSKEKQQFLDWKFTGIILPVPFRLAVAQCTCWWRGNGSGYFAFGTGTSMTREIGDWRTKRMGDTWTRFIGQYTLTHTHTDYETA